MPRTATKKATKKTTKRAAKLTTRGPGRKPNNVKVVAQVDEKRQKFGYEDPGKLTPAETRIVNLFRASAGTAKGLKPVDRAAQLEIGETHIFTNYSLHGFANSVKRLERDYGKQFNYHEAPFSPGAGLTAENVLWIKRIK